MTSFLDEIHNEADKLKFIDKETLYKCLIVRGYHGGHLCGYVKIPECHPFFERPYDERIPSFLYKKYKEIMNNRFLKRSSINDLMSTIDLLYSAAEIQKTKIEYMFDVHGGITFAGEIFSKKYNINGFWYGFDCGHEDDIKPDYSENIIKHMISAGCTYKNIEYVKNECASLAKQLKEISDIYKESLNEKP